MAVGRVAVGRVEIDELSVRKLRVTDLEVSGSARVPEGTRTPGATWRLRVSGPERWFAASNPRTS